MSSTKIINVLKDDSFQEILDLFKDTPAEEVIFVLPKSARAFKKEEHFSVLRDQSKSLGKAVSFLCSNSETNDLAKKYKFDVLLAHSTAPRKKTSSSHPTTNEKGSINIVNQIEDFYAEPATSDDSISTIQTNEDLEDDLDTEDSTDGRRLDDVFVPEVENKHNVKVSGGREKSVDVEVNQVDFDHEPIGHHVSRELKGGWGFMPKLVSVKDRINRSNRPAHRIGLIVMSCVAIIVLGTVVFITTGKAEIVIKPNSQPLDFKLTVFASDNISEISLTGMSVPGQLFNIQKTVSQDFTATGHVDVAQKARGTITVYNELSVDQPLVVTTRFESADNHIFHTLTSIVVPAGKTISGKFVPGSKDVQIIADKSGSEYNVPAGQFTIPAFKEQGATEKYQKVYGKSTAPILNGTSGQSTVVTETDLNTAKETLTTQLSASIQDELKAQIDNLKVVNDNQILIGDPVSTSPADAKTSTFKVSLAGSLKTIGFRESDLSALITQYVETQKDMIVIPDKLTLIYQNINWDESKKGLTFTVHVAGPSYTKVDQVKIIGDLLGKNSNDMKAYLGAISGISSANVSLSPFWVRSIPKNQDRVRIDVSY